jgi:predicted HTH transcriptional regulator
MFSEGDIHISDLSQRDLKLLIERGESVVLEFKKTIPSAEKIAREICAFANTMGGFILVGVADNGAIVGIRDYFEEEHWIREAAEKVCDPLVEIRLELIHLLECDVLLVRVPEALEKPVSIRFRNVEQVYVRKHEESIVATPAMIGLLRMGQDEDPVTFVYGQNEQKLFRFIHEYGEIHSKRYAELTGISEGEAAKTLIQLVKVGVLMMFKRDQTEFFCFSKTL